MPAAATSNIQITIGDCPPSPHVMTEGETYIVVNSDGDHDTSTYVLYDCDGVRLFANLIFPISMEKAEMAVQMTNTLIGVSAHIAPNIDPIAYVTIGGSVHSSSFEKMVLNNKELFRTIEPKFVEKYGILKYYDALNIPTLDTIEPHTLDKIRHASLRVLPIYVNI